MKKKWVIAPQMPVAASQALESFPRLFRKVLYNRGIADLENANRFLSGGAGEMLDPFLLKDMEKAVERILRAYRENEKIAIYGDYDVDGVTATALLFELFKGLGFEVEPYIPHRFDEGYGLNTDALQSLADRGTKVVITVDCGIRSMDEALYAADAGLDLIITDHHHPLDEIPEAFAVINPKQAGDEYPSKELAGVGVAYKLAQAVLLRQGIDPMYSQRWLDLVALGTVADLAPLIGENRTLVHAGLKVIQSGRRLGLRVLANVAGIRISTTTASDIGFTLGPRLNAAGRLKTAMDAFHLLITEDESEALSLAQNLNHSNTERQEMTRETQQKSIEMVAGSLESDYLLFVVDPLFNEGIVGLAASRLTEQFYRPSVVGKIDETTTRCSCRSIPEFHITNALDECRDLLVRHGGHAAAAGFTVDNSNLNELISRLKAIARRELHGTELIPTYHADAETPITELDRNLSDYLDQLQPTGYGNPEPYFVSRGVRVFEKKRIGTEGKHLKMKLSAGYMKMDAIAFNFGYLIDAIPEQIDIFYTFEKNAFNGYVNLQVRIKDIQFTE